MSSAGSFLSGGLDSSAITCVAGDHEAALGKPLHSFSAVWPTVAPDHPKIDELEFMKSVIESSGSQAHFVNCGDDDPWKDIDELVSVEDHPVGFPNMYVHWEICKGQSGRRSGNVWY